MQSAAHRGFTVVTVVTLFFTPVLKGHHWIEMLTGKSVESHVEQCESHHCPAQQHIVQKVVLPAQPSDDGSDQHGSPQDPPHQDDQDDQGENLSHHPVQPQHPAPKPPAPKPPVPPKHH